MAIVGMDDTQRDIDTLKEKDDTILRLRGALLSLVEEVENSLGLTDYGNRSEEDWEALAPARAMLQETAWDRSQCQETVCTCHDDTAPPYTCSGCGCRARRVINA